jgi:hypothetical protein
MTFETAVFDNSAKQMLEDLFGMSTGYVMDFNNGTFASFVQTCIGFDPYQRYEGSKAVVLRQIWLNEPFPEVAKLNLDLLSKWKLNKLRAGEEPTKYEQHALEALTALFTPAERPALSADDLAFLNKDLGAVDLTALPKELTAQQVISARLDKIDRALDAGAQLAVIFLVGSTLEGLLAELSLAHASTFASAAAAPKGKGTVKPLDAWTLSELITVSRALGLLSEDVAKHADQVRNFRNYVHPRQQLKENFEPRIETARIAQQVLRAALADLQSLANPGGRGR